MCLDENVDYPGNDIKSYTNILTLDTCLSLCRQNPKCVLSAYLPSHGNACWAKYFIGPSRTMPGMLSTKMLCPAGEH